MPETEPSRPHFPGPVVLITGATGGLGQALARAIARSGATVVLHGRIVRKLEALYDALLADGAPLPAILPLDFETADTQAYAAAAIDTVLIACTDINAISTGNVGRLVILDATHCLAAALVAQWRTLAKGS